MPDPATPPPSPPGRHRWMWLAFIALALPVAAVVMARQDDRSSGADDDVASPTSPVTTAAAVAASPAATSVPATSSPAPSPTVDESTVPTTATMIDVTVPPTDLDVAVAQLLDELATAETDDRRREELDDVPDRIDDAIDMAQRGESKEAEKELDDVRRRIERAVDDRGDRDAALDLLDQIQALLDL